MAQQPPKHPILEKIPLMVSPFVRLPTAPTLSYNYKPMPSALPPSITEPATGDEKPQYVVSASNGHAAHPEEILASCRALHAHLDRMLEDATRDVAAWEERLRERELAEKRRIAPGWLDSEERMLEPLRAGGERRVEGEGEGEKEREGEMGREKGRGAEGEWDRGQGQGVGGDVVGNMTGAGLTEGMRGLSLWGEGGPQGQGRGSGSGVPAGVSEMGGGSGEELDRIFGGR